MTQAIEIAWKLSEVGAAATAPLKWSEHASGLGNERLENDLGWPAETFAILLQAFEARASRFAPWDLSGVKNKAPYQKAAEIYKRGAVTLPAPPVTQPTAGKYQIRFFASPRDIMEMLAATDAFIVIDREVALRWNLTSPNYFVIHLTETTKTLNSVAAITKTWKKQGQKKHWLVIGGGVLADAVAFAAALQGSTFTLVPTTLLAMADACVGGKTGVNFPPFGKNQVGLFAYPQEVIVATEWLSTLEPRQLKAGLTECLKHAYLSGDRQLIATLSDPHVKLADISAVLPTIVGVKAKVVEADPFEHGLRAVLNFGHTLGHAIEAYSQKMHPDDFLLHGEAVALGMIYAGLLSQKVAGLSKDDFKELFSSLQKAGCLPDTSLLRGQDAYENIFGFIANDKKADQESQWVLLAALGKPYVKNGKHTTAVDATLLAETWQEFIKILPR